MTKRFGLVIAAAAFAGTMASTAGAMTVNFEDEVFVGDAKNVGTSFSNGGISFLVA
ncbi:hypothetical protein [Tropicimonas sp. IMCC6043]|uniref:hypothetical protein n=1 Tax=Tropicimonas sp. IMCC6043 TaxID=2510645 RepID=UPI0013EB296C|nr:hypothetical protein [Tropicimonas sp. IMCC6043]